MSEKVVINPVTRVSGFLEITAQIEENIVADARTEGLLFRGFEEMLLERSPLDVIYFTQRICGICSTAHSIASAMALEDALGVSVPEQGRYLRDIIHGCEFLQNHIRHFYQYTVPDFIKLPDLSTLFTCDHSDFRLPKNENDSVVKHYFDSLEVSRSAHEMLAILGGKAPHNHGVFIGGITTPATKESVFVLCSILRRIKAFIRDAMIPDAYLIASYYKEYFVLGKSWGNFLSYGCFDCYKKLGTLYVSPKVYINRFEEELDSSWISENIHTSFYKGKESYTPFEEVSKPDTENEAAYSWIKAPRYKGFACETGPLARMWLSGDYRYGISCMDRTLARVLEAKKIAEIAETLLENLDLGVPFQKEYEIPDTARGRGMTDTVRGALGHWLKIDKKKISFYQLITPTAWNLSSRCKDNIPGPGEKSLIGTPVKELGNPVELGRIVRSFDPCISCATHVYSNGGLVKTFEVLP